MTETDAPTLDQILDAFEASGLEVSHEDDHEYRYTAKSDSAKLDVLWDTSDPGNVGWAWELRRYDPEGDLVSDDSGGLDSIEELTGLLESLGTGEVKATEALGPTETPTPVNDIQAVHDEAMADLRRTPPAERAAVHQTKPNSADVGSELAALRADLDSPRAPLLSPHHDRHEDHPHPRAAPPGRCSVSGLYGLPDSASFCAEEWEFPNGPTGTAVYVDGDRPDEPPILVLSDETIGEGSDYDVAHLIRRLLDLEHMAVVEGFAGAEQRLAEADCAAPVVIAALSYVVKQDASGLAGLRRAAREYMNSDAMRSRE